MKFAKRRSRMGIAGIVATVIMFAILFTVGTSYFIFVNSENSAYASALAKATSKDQGSLQESLSVNTVLETDGDVGFTATDTAGVTVNMTAVIVTSSSGTLLQCDGVGFPAHSGCSNSTPTLWISINAGATSASIDTGYVYVAGTTDTVKVLTARGNSYSQTYPEAATQSGSSQSVTVALDNLKWVQILPQSSSLTQKKYVANCSTSSCAEAFGSNVAAGDILVDAVSSVNQAPSGAPSDSQSDVWTAGPSTSVQSATTPALVQDKYTSNCNAATCGLAFTSHPTSGDTLVYAIGWANNAVPGSAPTDTLHTSFTQGEYSSTTVGSIQSLVQHRYLSNCSSATCALAFSSSVTSGNTLVFGLGWPSTQTYSYVPVTVTNCQPTTQTLALDGDNYATEASGTSEATTLTTTHSSDVIIAIAYGQNTGAGTYRTPSITDSSSLTWTARGSVHDVNSAGGNSWYGEVFYAIASSPLSSDTITLHWSTSPTLYGWLEVFGVSGANTSSPFDTQSGLPTYSAVDAYASVTTSNANDFIFGLENTAATTAPTTGSGFTAITSGVTASYTAAEYKIVSATQSSLSMTYSNAGSDSDTAVGDAIVQATSSCSTGLSVDSSASNECDNSTTCSMSLTTSNSDDVLYLMTSDSTGGNDIATTAITDTAGLSWTQRAAETGDANLDVYTYYAIATSPLTSDSITVHYTGSANLRSVVLAISGANIASPFDPNLAAAAKATATSTTPTVSLTTTNANDIIIGGTKADTSSVIAAATGYTLISCCTTPYAGLDYKIVSATGSQTPSFTISGSTDWGIIGDAIEAAPSTATPTNFQQMVTWDPATYSSYEASNLGNIRFCTTSTCSTELYSWLESCLSPATCTSSSTSATAWVDLGTNTISNGGTLTIYMVFEVTSTNFDDNYWGEAPQLSATYAQYDNGANVFANYWNFAGTSCPTGWTCTGTTINNGISAASTTANAHTTATFGLTANILDFYGSFAAATSTQNAGFGYNHDTANGPTVMWDINSNGGGAGCASTNACLQTGSSNSAYYYLTSLTATGSQVYSIYWGSTSSATGYVDYTSSGTSTTDIPTTAVSLGIFNAQGAAQATIGPFDWLRIRALPPNGVMPSTSFGTFNSGTGSPTSVSDTLGDTFTQGVSYSATVGSTAYESAIWYATASSSGADTITATFGSSISGTISIYEISGYSVSGVLSGLGGSTSSSATASLSTQSITPSSNSFVVGNVETASSSDTFTAGTGFTLSGTSGVCSSVEGCGEYESGLGSVTTVPFGLSPSTQWVDVGLAFAPLSANTYYSYIYYGTAPSTGADTISWTFAQTVAGSVSIYEFSGLNTASLLDAYGSSSSSQTSTSVTQPTSITPTVAGSVVVGNTEGTSTTYTAGTGYTLSGTCNTVNGCGEYETGAGTTATSVPMSVSPASPWAEAAISFPPVVTTYYTGMWYATAGSSAADTVTTSFATAGTASISMYDITGYTTSGASSSYGSATTAGTTASVTSFTPATDSFIVGNTVSASAVTYTAGTGFTNSGSGGTPCTTVYGCGEYWAGGGGSATTVPQTLGSSKLWAEVAMSFSTPFNPQSGIQVNGYPTMGVPSGAQLVWEVTFTNVDTLQRSITIWPQTEMAIGSAEYDGFDTDYTQAHYYLISSLNSGSTTVNAYSTTGFITLAYNVPTTLYFAATQALGSTTQAFGTNVLTPFEAYFALTGIMSDGTLFGETIPYPYGIITEANADSSPTAGAPGQPVTISCTSPCDFNDNDAGMVGWINSEGQLTQETTFTMSSSGNIPAGVTFDVPSVTPGYYTIEVTDYINSVFMTFQVT